MKTKQCNKCNKETKLAFKCEHCGAIQQWTMSEQLSFFKGLYNIKKGLYIGTIVIVATVSFQIFSGFETNSTSSSSSNKIDTCKCLTSSGYYNSNESSCDRVINAYIGGNWKGHMNQSQTAKWNQLKSRCGY